MSLRGSQPPRRRPLAGSLLSVLLVLTATPGTYAASPSDDEETLRQLLVETQKRAVMAEVEVERLQARVRELEAGGGAPANQPRSSQAPASAPPMSPPEPLPPENLEWPNPAAGNGLEEEDIEDDYRPEPIAAAPIGSEQSGSEPTGPQDLDSQDLDSQDQGSQDLGTAGSPANSAPASGGILNTDPPNPAAFELYDRGYSLFHQEQYREAETLFEQYIAEHPTTELADNALFWIGECRYARGEFDGALEAFTETVIRFPGGNKVPDALLKAGKCLEALGRPTEATATYRELTNRYPGSLAAIAAEERLTAL